MNNLEYYVVCICVITMLSFVWEIRSCLKGFRKSVENDLREIRRMLKEK